MNEPRYYLFFFRLTALARYFPAWRAAFSRLELTLGLTMTMSSRSALFLRRGWLSKSVPAFVIVFIRRGFNLPFCLPVLSRKAHVSSTTSCTLLSRRDHARVPGGALGCGCESSIPSLCRIHRVGRWFMAGDHCHDTFHQQVLLSQTILGSWLRSSSTGGLYIVFFCTCGCVIVKNKNKQMPNKWRTRYSLIHKIRHHGRRGKGTANTFSREKLRQGPQKEGG